MPKLMHSWQYTNEVEDEHTRGVVVRGGSKYYPLSSMWYFPQVLSLSWPCYP